VLEGAAFAEQKRLKLNRADQNAGHGGRYAELDQQIDKDEALFHFRPNFNRTMRAAEENVA
jgi:hypothetical protein